MAFWAAAGAILGLGSSIFGGVQQQNAARQANKEAKKQAEAQYKRSLKEWEIDFLQQTSNWMWQTAQTEAAKYAERVKESDYKWRSKELIKAAKANLAVNQAVIKSQYITEEKLRAKQEGMEYSYKMDELSDTSIETVRQYMSSIEDAALQGELIETRANRQSKELMSSLVFENQKDQLKWEAAQIASVMDQAQVSATASARMGGSASAERLAMNEAQKLGRMWGELELQSRDRANRVGLFNSALQGDAAKEMGRLALSIDYQVEKIKYTNDRYKTDVKIQNKMMKDLTIPGFKLAGAQGKRELTALGIQTKGVIGEASMPYRKSIIFDPLMPIKGLKPEYYAPTKIYEPSTAGIIGQSLISGVQGAINLGTYTKSDGTLGWR